MSGAVYSGRRKMTFLEMRLGEGGVRASLGPYHNVGEHS